MIQRPGLLLPYGIGMMRFLTMRSEAEEKLGDKFDLKEFNTVLMEGGDRPFEFVEADVKRYIESVNAPETEKEPEEEPVVPDFEMPQIPWEEEEPVVDAAVAKYGKYVYPVIGISAAALVALIAGINLQRRKKRGPFA